MKRSIYLVEVTTHGRMHRLVCGLCGRRGPKRCSKKIARRDANRRGWVEVAVYLIAGTKHHDLDACKRCFSRIFGGDRV